MRRMWFALGASMITVALGTGDAAATTLPDVTQQVTGSGGAVQVAAVQVHAPVRVLSRGDDSARGAQPAAAQQAQHSAGSAQVGAVDVHAPVRVLSPGDDSTVDGSPAPQESQTADGGLGVVQAAAPSVVAPVRVLSPAAEAAANEPGPPPEAPGTAFEQPTGTGTSGAPASVAGTRAGRGARRGAAADAPTVRVAPVAVLERALAELPFTGVRLWALACTGVIALLAGGALRADLRRAACS